ncbi:uncharacterized protein LOC124442516 isoform X2 [Xenia sp. Carnegie-2017]|nr:uncharacterized protein LOC124442516 isoform X2 [Xenia sp. Carnegie-2017]
MGNIVQGLWLDDNFRKTGLEYLKAKDEALKNGEEDAATSGKSFGGIDRSILRAYVAIRIMPVWKWLEFKDFIVDFENQKDCYTVGDVLGTLCTGLHKPVIRIVPKNDNETEEVRNMVKELLKTRTLTSLTTSDCPLSAGMLMLIAQGRYTTNIGRDKCQAFLNWVRHQDLKSINITSNVVQKPTVAVQTPPANSQSTNKEMVKQLKPRITFSQHEIDNLNDWFSEEERPSKEIMLEYTEILNIPRRAASMRLLTPESIFFWFKNRRAKKKRQELSLIQSWEEKNVPMGQVADVAMTTENGNLSVTMANSEDEGEEQNRIARILTQQNMMKLQLITESSGKTRKMTKPRVTFDPQTELTMLQQWFEQNERPNKDIMMEYTNILNEARAMNNKQDLSYDSIAMWFKNRRAKKRRIEEGGLVHISESQEHNLAMQEDKKENNGSLDEVTDVSTTEVKNSTLPIVAKDDQNGDKETLVNNDNGERNVYNAGLVAIEDATM